MEAESSNLQMTVDYNIRGYRKLKQLSQEALAVKSKLSSNYLGEVERGKQTISVRRVGLIARIAFCARRKTSA